MRLNQPVEQIIQEIHSLDRRGCLSELRTFERPRLDFTDEFLNHLSLEQLRHILMAACLQARKPMPRPAAAAAHANCAME